MNGAVYGLAATAGAPVLAAGALAWWGLGRAHVKLFANPPWWPLVVRRHPGYRHPPPRYPEPHVYDYTDCHAQFSTLCKAYEADMLRMGASASAADPAAIARAVAEQMRLPYSYGRAYHGGTECKVYFKGHPSARYMQGGTVLGCSAYEAKQHNQFWPPGTAFHGEHWSEGILGSMQWR